MNFFCFSNPVFLVLFIVLIVWDFVWKGFALWKAAKNNHEAWFVCIFIFNTVGVLPIVYLLMNKKEESNEL